MTLPLLPREWSSDTNYSSGAVPNTPTKVDPGAALALQGFVPGLPTAAQHFNSILNIHSRVIRRMLTNAALKLQYTDYSTTNEAAMAAISSSVGGPQVSGVLTIKSGASNVKTASDGGRPAVRGSVASITSLVVGCARNPSTGRIVAIGTGGNNNCFSDDFGATWTAGGAMSAVPVDIVWNPTHSRFISGRATTGVRFSADAVAWSNGTTSLDSAGCGLAVLANGNTIACGLDGGDTNNPAFSVSTNGGTSWADTGGTVANPDSYTTTNAGGWVCGNGGGVIWHVGSIGEQMIVSSSPDGASWTTLAELRAAPGVIGGGLAFRKPKIMCCPETGLLVVVGDQTGRAGALLFASLDGGATWTPPVSGPVDAIDAYALAAGRLFCSDGTDVLATDGVGWF
jgi:hypothetical protein